MIMRTVDDRRTEDRVVESADFNKFFGSPLRTVITGNGVGTRAEGAHVNDAFDAGGFRRGEDVFRAERVHVLIGVLADFADDADEMDDGVHAFEAGRQRSDIEDFAAMNLSGVLGGNRLYARRLRIARKNPDHVSGTLQMLENLFTNKS